MFIHQYLSYRQHRLLSVKGYGGRQWEILTFVKHTVVNRATLGPYPLPKDPFVVGWTGSCCPGRSGNFFTVTRPGSDQRFGPRPLVSWIPLTDLSIYYTQTYYNDTARVPTSAKTLNKKSKHHTLLWDGGLLQDSKSTRDRASFMRAQQETCVGTTSKNRSKFSEVSKYLC